MALNIELFYIISRKLSLCGLFWTTLYMHTHMHTYIYMDACMHAYILVYMHIYTFIHTYMYHYRGFVLVRRGFCPGVFCLKGFVRIGFCEFPLQPEYKFYTSVTTES